MSYVEDNESKRHELLVRKLCRAYGLALYGSNDTIKRVSMPFISGHYVFDRWSTALFGSSCQPSLNDFIKQEVRRHHEHVWSKIKLVDFQSADELDIQLTLMGMNSWQ